jgi:hypothetical protein
MEDLHRRVIHTLKTHAPGMQAELVREKKHVILDFTYQGVTHRQAISKTPRDEDVQHRSAVASVCKAFNLTKPRM